MPKRPLILISNDDGVQAQGIRELTSLMCQLGDVVVVAPDGPRSGAACSISPITPVTLREVSRRDGLLVCRCSGTPTDCVKLALEKVVPRTPDLVVSGINHGDNASVSLHYSGTVGAVLEACMKQIPAIAFSLRTSSRQCDFQPYRAAIADTARHVLTHGLPPDVLLNVNFPEVSQLAGVKVCRMARGTWKQEWEETAPGEFALTGYFVNLEAEAEDTDYWALDHAYAAITPLQLDMTAYGALDELRGLAEPDGTKRQ